MRRIKLINPSFLCCIFKTSYCFLVVFLLQKVKKKIWYKKERKKDKKGEMKLITREKELGSTRGMREYTEGNKKKRKERME